MTDILTDEQVKHYRELFPIVNNYIYLNHAGVAPVSSRVSDKVADFMCRAADKAYADYESWMEEVEDVRGLAARLINSDPLEVAFIKNTSHGISLIAQGIEWKLGDNIIIFEKDFPSNVYSWLDLRRQGVDVRQAPLKDGGVNIKEIEKLIDNNTRLLSISSVQFTNGYRADLAVVGNLCREHNIYFCVDAIQSLGVVPMDVKKFGIDFLAADGHKWLLSPEGTGIFYCSDRVVKDIHPVLLGWKSMIDENEHEVINFNLKPNALRFEEATLNVLGILALGAGLELLLEVGIENVLERIQLLGDTIMDEAQKRDYVLKTPLSREQRAGIVSFSGAFDTVKLKDTLASKNVIVNVRAGALRVAPHFYNTQDEILILFKYIDEIIAQNGKQI